MIDITQDNCIFCGSYPQNGTEPQPIKWRILHRQDDVLTVISDVILFNDDFDINYSNYKISKIRKLINNQFVPTAFTAEELAHILPTQLEEDVTDKVYLPSLEEIKLIPRDERIRKVTPYAISTKASAYPAYTKKELPLKNNGWYWTRTPYKPPYDPTRYNHAWYVTYNGAIQSRNVWGYDIGVVLMMRVKI